MPLGNEELRLLKPVIESRLAELEAEAAQLRALLGQVRARAAKAPKAKAAPASKRKRKGMSAAQKEEVSKRMKAYWAARRAKKGR